MIRISRTLAAAAGSAAFVCLAGPALASTVTFTGAGLGDLTFSAQPGHPDASATLTGSGANTQVSLSSGNVRGAFLAEVQDTGGVYIPFGSSIGNKKPEIASLNDLLAAGAAGDVSYHQTSVTSTNGHGSNWQVVLVDPNNSSNSIVVDPYGLNTIGTAYFNQGDGVYTGGAIIHVQGYQNGSLTYDGPVCGAIPSACGNQTLLYSSFTSFASTSNTWSDLALLTVDGTTLGDWKVATLGVVTGGYGDGAISSVTIDSITVPGSPVPEPSTWVMMLVGVTGLGGTLRARRQHAIAIA